MVGTCAVFERLLTAADFNLHRPAVIQRGRRARFCIASIPIADSGLNASMSFDRSTASGFCPADYWRDRANNSFIGRTALEMVGRGDP